jgi:hypothetical protein
VIRHEEAHLMNTRFAEVNRCDDQSQYSDGKLLPWLDSLAEVVYGMLRVPVSPSEEAKDQACTNPEEPRPPFSVSSCCHLTRKR